MGGQSRERRFVVSGHPTSLPAIVEKLAPGDANALREGRVFVDGKRVDQRADRVNPGSRVTWYAPRLCVAQACDVEFSILDRRDDFLVAAKPALWSSEPDRTGRTTSLREQAARLLGVRELHVATRLDAGVSGLVLLALSKSACRHAVKLLTLRQMKKEYLAVVIGKVEKDERWDSPVDGSRSALTLIHPLAESGLAQFASHVQAPASLLRITPITGRRHQIRIHAAGCGRPLLGDRRYGGAMHFVRSDGTVQPLPRLMLHAWRLNIPWEGQYWTTVCPVPSDMREMWAVLGGRNCWPET